MSCPAPDPYLIRHQTFNEAPKRSKVLVREYCISTELEDALQEQGVGSYVATLQLGSISAFEMCDRSCTLRIRVPDHLGSLSVVPFTNPNLLAQLDQRSRTQDLEIVAEPYCQFQLILTFLGGGACLWAHPPHAAVRSCPND
ncbi:hypothetical protein RRG08_065454 [Elysia crispata]|uniref:Uncharacterized protein n=1 Tax=Elysia crispata TaxID=231223 RepID=A0AAE1CN69_9GAST|nr:hypothetical protein RRG08_065454 [Elysia crispata]